MANIDEPKAPDNREADSRVVSIDTGKPVNREISRRTGGTGGVKDKDGLTLQQRQWAQLVGSQAISMTEAYRRAYDASNMDTATMYRRAYDLSLKPQIKAVVDKLVAERVQRTRHDSGRLRTYVAERLLVEAEREGSKASDRLKAIELIGKLTDVAAFTERTSTETKVSTVEEVKERISTLLTKLSA